jgi:hypothetical protein
VLATGYSNGGGLQWGGRFYAVSLPVLIPMALVTLAQEGGRFAPAARHVLAGVAAALTITLAATAVWTLRSVHDVGRRSQVALSAAAAQAPAGDGGSPVLVTSAAVWPRFEWQIYPDVRWQLVPLGAMRDWSTQLSTMRVKHFVLITGNPQFEMLVMSPQYSPGPLTPLIGGYSRVIFTLRADPSRS